MTAKSWRQRVKGRTKMEFNQQYNELQLEEKGFSARSKSNDYKQGTRADENIDYKNSGVQCSEFKQCEVDKTTVVQKQSEKERC